MAKTRKLHIGRYSKDHYELGGSLQDWTKSAGWPLHSPNRFLDLCRPLVEKHTPIRLKVGEVAELKVRITRIKRG